jgi:hypothetical protein
LAFDFISDVAAQALAWNYLGDKLKTLKYCGLRTSIEIKNFYDKVAAGEADAAATLVSAAKLADLDTSSLLNVSDEIANDPYTLFLAQLWGTTLDEIRT